MSGRAFWLVLALLGVGAWFAIGPSDEAANPKAAASPGDPRSAVPCDVPLAWQLTEVDERFGLREAEVEAALREAAALWERATGVPLFRHDRGVGMPVRLIFDERQERTGERRAAQRELDREGERIQAQRQRLDELHDRLERESEAHEARWRALQQRVARHNARVERLNRDRDVPDDVVRQIRQAEATLEADRRAFEAAGAELRRLQRTLDAETERFNRQLDRYNRRADVLEERFPAVSFESGRYREQVETRDGRVVSLDRGIDIFQFRDRRELVRVAAHELGHALGLGHVDVPDAIMSERSAAGYGAADPEVTAADMALLSARCPGLFESR